MKIIIGIIICSSIMLISAAIVQDNMLNDSAPLLVENKSSTSLSHAVKKVQIISESGLNTVIRKKLTNLTHEVITSFRSTENMKNFTDYSIKKETTNNLTEKIVRKISPKSLSQEPTHQWTLAGTNGASITVKFSAQINGTYDSADGFKSLLTTFDLPKENNTQVTGDCNGEIKNINISWASPRPLQKNWIDLYFVKSDNDDDVYRLKNLYLSVSSSHFTEIVMVLRQYKQHFITECKKPNEQCSYHFDVKQYDKLKDYEVCGYFFMNNFEFHITDNAYNFEFTLFVIVSVIGLLLLILICLMFFKRSRCPDYYKKIQQPSPQSN